jgi:hypothetical protein
MRLNCLKEYDVVTLKGTNLKLIYPLHSPPIVGGGQQNFAKEQKISVSETNFGLYQIASTFGLRVQDKQDR